MKCLILRKKCGLIPKCQELSLEWWLELQRSLSSEAIRRRASYVALGVKNLPAKAGNVKDMNSIPGLGRFPRGDHGNPLPYSCLENPCGWRSLASYSSWSHKELDTTEWLSTAHSTTQKLISQPPASPVLPPFRSKRTVWSVVIGVICEKVTQELCTIFAIPCESIYCKIKV